MGECPATLAGHALYGPGLPYVTVAEEDSVVVGNLVFVAPERYRLAMLLEQVNLFRQYFGRPTDRLKLRIEGFEQRSPFGAIGRKSNAELSKITEVQSGLGRIASGREVRLIEELRSVDPVPEQTRGQFRAWLQPAEQSEDESIPTGSAC